MWKKSVSYGNSLITPSKTHENTIYKDILNTWPKDPFPINDSIS